MTTANPSGRDDRFERAIAAIDEANAADPVTIEVGGHVRPKEQAHAEMMTDWVRRLDSEADEAQLLAARAHHLRRWAIPRHTYPDGRAGYLRWRADLRRRHAAEVGDILAAVGYEEDTIDRVRQIVGKEHLRTDSAVQTHEDALCLVFLETQIEAVALQLGDERTIDLLRKTLKKMSPRGIEAAFGLSLSDATRRLLTAAASAPA